MNVRYAWVIAVGCLCAGCATTGGVRMDAAILAAKDRVAPALVHIRPVKEVFAQGIRQEVPLIGSGFIISADGYVVTNEHVAGQSKFVRCVLGDKTEVDARVVGTDPYTDLAVLKLDLADKLPYIAFADISEVEEGQTVLAFGSPHGLSRSVSLGIISVTGRYLESFGAAASPFNTWLQTDAAINQGNSGGPLVNLAGKVVGVNSRMLQGAENIGFAIPVDVVSMVVDELRTHGRVRRSWIGLNFQELRAMTDDPNQRGVLIADIDPLSPASKSDIRPGDVLLAINGAAVDARFEEDLPSVRQRIAQLPIADAATLRLRRGTQEHDVTVVTEEMTALRGLELEFPEWGFTATDPTPDIARRAGLDSIRGILITGVRVGGPASNAKLAVGDVLLELDDEALENLAQFRQLYEQRLSSGQERVLLFVKHGALTRFALIDQSGQNADETIAPVEGAPGL